MPKHYTPKLSPRLEGIVSLVPVGSRIADVGCDHGYISIALVQRGVAISSIASDIKAGPLAQAEKNINKAELSAKIETRLAPGISALEAGEADVIVIAGMGQRTIADILTEKMEVARAAKYLILQPQSELDLMRSFLIDNGFSILKNKLMREGDKYYFAMVASATEKYPCGEKNSPSEAFKRQMQAKHSEPEMIKLFDQIDLLFGWDLIYTDRELAFYLNHVLGEWSEALEKLSQAKKVDYDRIAELSAKKQAAEFALELNTMFCGINKELLENWGIEEVANV